MIPKFSSPLSEIKERFADMGINDMEDIVTLTIGAHSVGRPRTIDETGKGKFDNTLEKFDNDIFKVMGNLDRVPRGIKVCFGFYSYI